METKTFKDLGLSEVILKGLEAKGFEAPSPIQAEIIPVILNDERDVVGQAQTGTGKTAAFGLPVLESISESSDHIQALILTPTRELTIQVADELNGLRGKKHIKITPIYGGQSFERQKRQLQRPSGIVVGTPGRLIDHMKSGNMDLSKLEFAVLDEADEMLTAGFVEDIELILSQTNPERKTLLFSATMPAPIARLAKEYMKESITVAAKAETLTTSLTEQLYFEVRESDKLEALCRIMDVEDQFYGLIFCRTKRDVDAVTEKLIHRGYDAEAMHGDFSQHQREHVLQKFRRKICSILVVTDMASRGLDITGLSHVINYALPQDPESYVHRIGRTGRAGQSGTAITFISPREYRKLVYIQKTAKATLKKSEVPSVDRIVTAKKDRVKRTVQEAIEDTVENDYIDFAETLLENYNPKEALAGVLKVAFESQFSEEQYTDIKAPKPSSDRGSRRERDGRNDRGRRERGRREKNQFVDMKGQTRLFVAKGKLDRMNARDLVDYICNQSGVKQHKIQGVEIYDKFSFVNAPFQDAEQILSSFKKDGRRSVIERAK